MEVFAEITALAAISVTVVQQLLKLNAIPVYFANKYPLITNIALSIIASTVVTWQTAINLKTIAEWVAYVGTVVVLSAITYNMTLRNSESVQRISNKTTKEV